MYYYILNPSAGRGALSRIQIKLQNRLTELGISGEFAKTTGPGEAPKMAASAVAKGYKTIVAVGGDGTVNEIVNALPHGKVAVGIIPIGLTNQLAHHLGIQTWQQACEVLAARRLIVYNLIAAGNHFFLSEMTLRPSDAQDEPPKKSFLGPTQAPIENQPTCHLKIDDAYELESPFSHLSITNQKFTDNSLPNQLVVSITSNRPAKTRSRFSLRSAKPTKETSHFNAGRIWIDTNPASAIMIDGKDAGATPARVLLTERQIQFIGEKPEWRPD